MADPGYPQAITDPTWDYFELGRRSSDGAIAVNGDTIDWKPVGTVIEDQVEYAFGVDPGAFSFRLPEKHWVNDEITDIRRTVWHFRCGYDGLEYSGRILKRNKVGPLGVETTYSGMDNRFHLKRGSAWVNNLFPAEVQFNITGKQDIVWGPVDPVFKNFVAKVFTRLNRPVYVRLPLKWPDSWNISNYTNLDDISSVDDLLDIILGAYEDLIALPARFTWLDELFAPTCDRLEMGVSVDLWDGHSAPPEVFSTSTLGKLQSILDLTSDHFLDLSQLGSVSSGLWQNTPPHACYLFDTTTKRDNRICQFRTDAQAGIKSYTFSETHGDAPRAIVGGKAPEVLNQAIEIGANLAISAIIFAISTIPGAGGLAGLSLTVGDLFDDVFFAYQVVVDHDLEDDLGMDAFGEIFADNTAAYSLDAYATGKRTLHEHGGTQTIEFDVMSGTDGRGIHFGQPETGKRAARKYQHGDTVTLWDNGTSVEQYVSKVTVGRRRDGGFSETATLGKNKAAQGLWERLITGVQDGATSIRGLANSI
ncbi:hypothetical protein [Gordonia sp. N1V]|uniref:Gp37-like protein n=1 Tax=Gordonia sp. N1V TaxID=3034163 RepID=UPI0023E1F23F|nr:hypothetical protein [Gordonia sp. N1V]MDF3280490.1 hypothetical protein [Gordonia sp. N1V]